MKTSIATGKTMKKQYKKFYKDYKIVTKELPNGKIKQVAEYIGKYYVCSLNEIELRKYKIYFLTLALCSSITVIGIGFLNNPGSRILYVSLPYVSLFLPMAYSLMGTVGFMTSGKRIELPKYDKTKMRIYRSTIWQIALSGITIGGDLIFFFLNKNIKMLQKEMLFVVGIILILVINIIFLQLQKKVIYQVEDSEQK